MGRARTGFGRAFRPATQCWMLAMVVGWSAAPVGAQSAELRPRSGSVTIRGVAAPEPRPDGRLEYAIGNTAGDIEIDGRLDEPAWSTAAVIPLPYEVDPGENAPAPVATECRLAHDDEHLYLGCAAHDPAPGGIRAYVVDRDAIVRHDRIVLTLDPFNDQRRAFQFGISALGVQYDAVLAQQGAGNPNQGGGTQSDPSWDAIWRSAGAITDDGYVVEAAIPFRSLRFPSRSDGAGWGAYLSRWWPRSTAVETRSATWDRDDACLLCQANVVTGIRAGSPGVNVQLTPTFTSVRTEVRPSVEEALVADPITREVGMDAQWGITSDLTLNLTANPDFSQVEADVAQLDVNNRFALFYPEKRPFFLEGADFFGTPIQAVFTRTIADPTGGAKVTGKIGANAIGILVARDRSNSLLLPGSQFSSAVAVDEPVTTAIARYRRDIGGSSTVGALYTGRYGDGYRNEVGGFDAFWRPVPSVTIQAQGLRSRTEYPGSVREAREVTAGSFVGDAARVQGQWSTNDWSANANVRSIDPDFRADAGFVTQAGVRGGSLDLTRRWWGASDRWFTQLRLEGGTWRTDDFDGNRINGGYWVGIGYEGPWQTAVGIWPNVFMTEHYAGTTYEDLHQLWFDVRTSPSGSLSFGLNGNVGDALDFANARQGFETRLAPVVEFRLGRNFEGSVRHTWQRLRADGRRVFTANLTQLRGVYNFSPRSFIRAVAQLRRTDRDPLVYVDPVDRRTDTVFAELLYAYKVNPQTVFFLGWAQNGAATVDEDRRRLSTTLMGRSFFLKLGYAWRP